MQATGKNNNNISEKNYFKALFIECFLTVLIINMIHNMYIYI